MGKVRRIVTGAGADGRSLFVSDGPAPQAGGMSEVWPARKETEPSGLNMPPGGLRWVVFDLPPDEVTRQHLAAQPVAGMEKDGFHQTPTLDLVMILDGNLTLELDTGSVELHAGDCVIQQGTRHAWRNRSDKPVRMACVVLSQHGVKPIGLPGGRRKGRK